MQWDWTSGNLARGLHCYRTRAFFEAHEHWEATWLACSEPDKTFLQSLIQVSAAFHHWQRGERLGTTSLLRRALRRLEKYPLSYVGVDVESLRSELRAWLTALDADQDCANLAVPTINFGPPETPQP